ncbi:amidohydrolase family protein [Kitasatospora sp. NPDC052896]|uniref:amidohydrolase family protein n=1 Tax=Kitasatospora sp. NPDC052896 TaxID=3364061 RepID=UPI0037C5BF02
MSGKIALEEHFNFPELTNELPQYVNPEMMKDIARRLVDLGAERLAEMDAAGIDYSLLSLTAPGIQGETDPQRAVTRARQANDKLADFVAANPDRYGGFAALPMQDPAAAATELERCVNELGFHGAMLNGFTNINDANTGWYYDHERYLPFWERVEALGVPAYLHPRDPLPGNQGAYEGHPELFGAVWTFTVETATHTLRLMTSGLFDRFPKLTVILGHLGETLPFNIWRIDHRAARMGDLIKYEKPLTHYLLNNFYVTTSGNFHTQTLNATMAEMGSDRVLYSSDYPYESMREASDWFDTAAISDNDRIKIGHTNARRLFTKLPERVGKRA